MSRRSDPPFSFGPSRAPRSPPPAWVKKLMIVVIIAGAVGGYLYYDPSLVEPYLKGTPLELPSRTTTIYRWRDDSGNLEHSNTPPPAGVKYEVLEISSDTNVIPLTPASQ